MSECSKVLYASRRAAVAVMRAMSRWYVHGGRTGPKGVYFGSSFRC